MSDQESLVARPFEQPDFDKCGACGAEANQYVYWNPTGGWSCLACGSSDYVEAAE